MARLLPCPSLAVVPCARRGHVSQTLAGNWASLPGIIGTVWSFGQVTVPWAKSRVKSFLVKRVPPCGHGRAMIYTPCAAHCAIRGLAMYPQVDVELQQVGGFLQLLDQQFYCRILRLVRRTHHDLARHFAVEIQPKVFLEAVEGFGAALATV